MNNVKTCSDGVNNFNVKDVAMSNVRGKVLWSTSNPKITRFCRNVTVKSNTESCNNCRNEMTLMCKNRNNNNNNNTNIRDNVYGAVITTDVITRVHLVLLTNVGQCQVTADPQTRPTDLGCESTCRLLRPTSTIAIYYYSALKLILYSFYCPTEVEGWVNLGTQHDKKLQSYGFQIISCNSVTDC